MKKHNGKNAIIVAGSIEKGQNEICKNVIRQFCTFVENAVVIDFYKGNKMQRLIGEGFDIIKYVFCKEDWLQEEESINEFLLDNNISSLFIFKTRMLKSFRYGNGKLAEDFIDTYAENKYVNRSFVMTRKILETVLFVNCCSNNNVKLIQLVIDPFEYDYRFVGKDRIKRLYILKKDRMKYCPMYEFEMNSKRKKEAKTYRMFFICTCISDERNDIKTVLNSMKKDVKDDSSFIIECVDNKKNKKLIVKQEDYYNMLSKS